MKTSKHSPRFPFILATACLAALAITALAQDFGFRRGGRGPFRVMPNPKYDGRFTFVRLNYQTAPGGYWYGGWPAWAHGYPLAEQNLMKIMNEISLFGANSAEINTVALDDPELFRYPVAYIIEVGWWTLSDQEAVALRARTRNLFFIPLGSQLRACYGRSGLPLLRAGEGLGNRGVPSRQHSLAFGLNFHFAAVVRHGQAAALPSPHVRP